MNLDKEDRRLWRTVLRTVRPFPFTFPTAKFLVGVSGGTDSLALLHLLWRQLGADRLIVAHLDHGLRPESADDAHFVANTAASWKIPCVTKKIQVKDVAASSGLSMEAAGRQVRYQFFAGEAKRVRANAVLVAHHADDQAETILLHLLRGSGSAGLRGMLPIGQVPGAEMVPLIRPFLNIFRSEIERYCAKHELSPRQDDSNEDVRYARNRIRHELLPLLQTYNPQIAARLQQLSIITADEYALQESQLDQIWSTLLKRESDQWLILDRHLFAEQAVAWQRLALRRAVQRLRPTITDIGFRTVEQARELILKKQSGSEATLPGQLVMQVTAQELIFGDVRSKRPSDEPQLETEQPILLPIPGSVNIGSDWRIVAELKPTFSVEAVRKNKERWRAFVSLTGGESVWIRPSMPGERFQPLGLKGHSQPIQDLLGDRKVARGRRPLWPVVATETHAVWIVGQHLDERVRVAADTARVVQLICEAQVGGNVP